MDSPDKSLQKALEKSKDRFKNDPMRIAYARLFTTPDGKVVLDNMKEQFYSCLLTVDRPNGLSVEAKAAQHDVIAQILKMIGDEE